jgi:hypothetical protein
MLVMKTWTLLASSQMVAKQPTLTQCTFVWLKNLGLSPSAMFTKQETEKSSKPMIKTEGKQSEESRCMLSENS